MPPRPRVLSDADRTDWAHVVRQIRPLAGRATSNQNLPEPVPAEPISPAARQTRPLPRPARRAMPGPVEVGIEPPGLDRASWQRFRGGKVATARRLDLHGMTTQHAFRALITFLRAAHADRLRCVEVITGRGSGEGIGTIRRELPIWLNLPDIRPLVLAASHPHAANPGSVRILLRRPR